MSIAHGYAKVTGRPMAAAVHDVVGLLHATMTIYYAHVDRAPVLVLGATGPVDRTKRRPHIDWIHTAQVNANAVRDYTKWDDQPATVPDFPASFARAYRMATTEPAGPVYVCYDAGLQEEKLERPIDVSAVAAGARPSPAQADPAAIARAAELLAHAERPEQVDDDVGSVALLRRYLPTPRFSASATNESSIALVTSSVLTDGFVAASESLV